VRLRKASTQLLMWQIMVTTTVNRWSLKISATYWSHVCCNVCSSDAVACLFAKHVPWSACKVADRLASSAPVPVVSACPCQEKQELSSYFSATVNLQTR
jgi:hypothetical protein